MFLPKKLAEIRRQQRYSQRTLAAAAGINAGLIASLESGRVKDPGASKIEKIARVLGVSATVFFADDAVNNQHSAPPSDPAA